MDRKQLKMKGKEKMDWVNGVWVLPSNAAHMNASIIKYMTIASEKKGERDG